MLNLIEGEIGVHAPWIIRKRLSSIRVDYLALAHKYSGQPVGTTGRAGVVLCACGPARDIHRAEAVIKALDRPHYHRVSIRHPASRRDVEIADSNIVASFSEIQCSAHLYALLKQLIVSKKQTSLKSIHALVDNN